MFIVLVLACQPMETDLGLAKNYLPKAEYLKKGVVNKYYSHFNPGDNADIRTNIFYKSYQLTKSNEMVVNNYNAGFELNRSRTFTFHGNQMMLNDETNYYYADTIKAEIIKPVFLNWDGTGDLQFEKILAYTEKDKSLTTEHQRQVRDTTVLNKPAKFFEKDAIMRSVTREDTTHRSYQSKITYVEGFGLFEAYEDQPDGKFTLELVEQMSLADFNTLANHGRKRVAYIDPKEAIDQNTDFKLCGPHQHVADYYNSSPDGRFAEGKRVMLNIILSKVDQEKLYKESGYLTFRFIVNCHGEAGWFVTEQADLEFQEKQFNQQTIDHLYEIVYNLKTWSPCVIMGERQDAYFYLTFRLKNGEILDILP